MYGIYLKTHLHKKSKSGTEKHNLLVSKDMLPLHIGGKGEFQFTTYTLNLFKWTSYFDWSVSTILEHCVTVVIY